MCNDPYQISISLEGEIRVRERRPCLSEEVLLIPLTMSEHAQGTNAVVLLSPEDLQRAFSNP
jgi:hypothetical protein